MRFKVKQDFTSYIYNLKNFLHFKRNSKKPLYPAKLIHNMEIFPPSMWRTPSWFHCAIRNLIWRWIDNHLSSIASSIISEDDHNFSEPSIVRRSPVPFVCPHWIRICIALYSSGTAIIPWKIIVDRTKPMRRNTHWTPVDYTRLNSMSITSPHPPPPILLFIS